MIVPKSQSIMTSIPNSSKYGAQNVMSQVKRNENKRATTFFKQRDTTITADYIQNVALNVSEGQHAGYPVPFHKSHGPHYF